MSMPGRCNYYDFPALMPDEHLLSGLLRFARRNPSVNFKNAVIRISSGITDLAPHMPFRQVNDDIAELFKGHCSKDSLLDQHTLRRYFLPFIPDGQAPGDSPPKLYGRLNVQRQWRWCAHCLEEDLDRHGFFYFRTVHQLPGIAWCDRHQTPLVFRCYGCQHSWEHIGDFFKVPSLPSRCPICSDELGGHSLQDNQTVRWLHDTSVGLHSGGLVLPPLRQISAAYRAFIGSERRPSHQTLATRNIMSKANHYVYRHLDDEAAVYLFQNFIEKRGKSQSISPLPLMRAAYEEQIALHPLNHLLLIRILFGGLQGLPTVKEDIDDGWPALAQRAASA